MSSFKRSAVVAAAAAAAVLPAGAAAAQEPEIPAEGWEYSEQWDFVRDEFTAEAQDETEEALTEHFEEWTFAGSLPMTRLQNYYIDGENETPVQRKFRADFYVDQTGEGLETALYLPGGITDGVQDLTGGAELDMHYLLHCHEGDTECGETALEDGTVVAWTTDTTYVEAAAFFPDGSVATVWWGDMDDDEVDVTVEQVTDLAADLDTEPVWEALKADSES
ncbi:hypothetical protein K3N28_09655 [Glycomyces sp. TRM65418]|uniref:hypothetical protein n=1 Tax=Glycomyces sp. TRM65418 TaxID=2867006 RepID=UPI001CE5F2C8|nr:hypothetical protein [Glycomyces sp. TRM65418]MCC3763336.1 hypothetical protein [Glycomyces sp. TRM65418]QZD57333.1 hypothetical protein K3N28_09595 [Glycomyces sp. TRM65418]